MTGGMRWDIRPEQRSQNGLKGLARSNPPTLDDILIDRVDLSVKGVFALRGDEDSGPRQFDALGRLLAEQDTVWTSPHRNASNTFRVKLRNKEQWTFNASLRAQLDKQSPKLTLLAALNPVRTLHHRLAELPDDADFVSLLIEMSPSDFFAPSLSLQQLQSIDGNDNYLPDIALAKRKLGNEYFSQFLNVYDLQFRRWIGEAISLNSDFRVRCSSARIVAGSDTGEMRMDWSHLTVRSAELYFERRHSGAPALLDRLTRKVLSAQSGSTWRSYGQNEVGERRLGTEVIGLDLTASIQQKYYGKTPSRIRCETRYTKGIRNVLRETLGDATNEAFLKILHSLREDVKKRCQWDAFCDLCAEPKVATLHEASMLLATVAIEADKAGVDAGPFLGRLLATGGVDLSNEDGGALSTLINRLIDLEVLEIIKLQRRYRPGMVRRYTLSKTGREIAELVQRSFALAEDHGN